MIGIDIGSKFIKVCKIIKEKKSTYSILAGMIDSSDKLSEQSKKLSLLLEKLRIDKDECFLAVSGENVIYRELFVPKNIDKKNLKNVATLEFSQSVSEDISQTFSAYTLLEDASSDKSKLLYTTAPKQLVYAKLNVIKHLSNLLLSGVTMETIALANSFLHFGPDYKNNESVMIVNIGVKTTNIVVLRNKNLVFMRDINFGGNDITADFVSSYTIKEKLAEELKKRTELWETIGFNLKNSLKKSSASLLESIFRTIEHCITRQFIVSMDRIIITGGTSKLKGIESFIEETLGIPTSTWNPLDELKVNGYTNKDYGNFISVALGLALEKGE